MEKVRIAASRYARRGKVMPKLFVNAARSRESLTYSGRVAGPTNGSHAVEAVCISADQHEGCKFLAKIGAQFSSLAR